MLGPTAHTDTFSRDNLPPREEWPDFLLDGFDYPEYLNAGVELTDRMVEKGFGDHTALIGNGRRRTYKELSDWTNRLAHALAENYRLKPGNRVLIRAANNPAMVACWLAATKAGAVVVNTMPMLRAGELAKIVDKAEIQLALCDTRLMDEIVACGKDSRFLKQVVGFDGTANHDAELDRIALDKPVRFDAVATGRDDVALLGLHLRHDGPAEGDDALSPRSPDHRGRLRPGCAGGHARRRVRGLAAACLHLRAGRAGGLPAALWSGGHAAGKRLAAPHGRDHREISRDDFLHRADRLSRHAGRHGEGRRSLFAAHRGLGRRNPAGPGLRGVGAQDRQADPRRYRRDRDAAHLHFQPARRHGAGQHGQAGDRL